MKNLFEDDYNLQDLKRIKVKPFGFDLYVTPRFGPHYTSEPYEAATALLVREKASQIHAFIDVGAHYGFFPVLVGRQNPHCRILAFEPVPENFEILKRNIELNGISKAHLFRSAVSNREGYAAFQVSAASDNSGFIANPAAPVLKSIDVNAVRLDHFIHHIPNRPTLVKIDTEGSEIQVLEGMQGLIRTVDELDLLIEFNQRCLNHHGVAPEELLQQIIRLGFSVSFIHDEDGGCEPFDGRRPWTEYMRGKNYKNLYCVKNRIRSVKTTKDRRTIPGPGGKAVCLSAGLEADQGNRVDIRRKKPSGVRKVLLVNHNLPPYELSGTPLSTLHHALGMVRKGVEVAVLIPSPTVRKGFRKEKFNNFGVYHVPSFDKYQAYFAAPGDEVFSEYRKTISRIVDDFSPQVVHINDYVYMPAEIIEIFSRKGCIVVRNVCNCEEICHRDYPVIADGLQGRLCSGPDDLRRCARCFALHQKLDSIGPHMSQTVEERIKRRFEHIKRLYLSDVDKVIFTSEAFRTYFTRFVPIPDEKTVVIPRGFHFDFERDGRHRGGKSGSIHFAFIGNIMFSKGIDVVLKAFEILCDRNDFVLHLYGAIVDHEYLPHLKRLEERHPGKLRYHGPFNKGDLPQISRQIDVCIIPSYFDTYNRVLREVLYLGIPVIVTDFFGAFIVEDGKNGYKIPVGDADSLSGKMIEIINDPSRIEKLAEEAAKTRIPGLEEEVDRMIGIYDDLYACSLEKEAGDNVRTQPVPRKRAAGDDRSVRLIAFYLPQYHPIPENDAWWGKGFTEWTNVVRAKPLFPGHHQPHLPADLGFYDLRLPEVRRAQADLAKAYGIYGFCYYHYWFNGKLLLERPLQEVLKSGEPDFPFCLCWANENWTRTWDGAENHILMEQTYSEEDDRNHIRYLCGIFEDKRYIRIDGKPLFLVYRAGRFPDPLGTTSLWRAEARRLGIGEIYLCRVESFPDERTDPRPLGFDAAVEFQPDWNLLSSDLRDERVPDLAAFRYEKVVDRMLTKQDPPYKRFPCVTPSWDSTARRKKTSIIFTEPSPVQYGRWLHGVVRKVAGKNDEEKIVFINAWNEWGEGNHLEPDQRFGHAYLEATKRALEEANRSRDWSMPAEAHEDILKRFITAGRRSEAVYALEKLVASFPDYAPGFNDLGVLYGEQGDNEKALTALEKAVSLDPTRSTFLKNLADFYSVKTDRIDEAFEIYQRILTQHPDDFETHVSLSHIAVRMGRFDVARKLLTRIQAADPEHSAVRDSLKAFSDFEQTGEPSSPSGEMENPSGSEMLSKQADRPGGSVQISIVVPVFNQVDYTKKCVEAITRNTPDIRYELIFIDNASTDDTPAYLKSLRGRTKIITNETNVGFTEACNQGARTAEGEYVVFLNNDTEPQEGWLQSLVDLARSDDRIGIVGSKLLYPDGRLQEAGGIIFRDGQGWNYGRLDDPDKPEYSYVREVDYVSGACLLARRDLLERLNHFDGRYAPGYYEDTDLCFGARSLGYKVLFCPFSRVIHHEGISSGTDLSRGMKKYQVVNRAKFVRKWAEELKRQHEPQAEKIVAASERNVRGNILIIDPSLPMFDRASGSLRLFHIVRLLKNQGYHITFIARNGSGQERYARILQEMGIEVYATDPAMLRSMGIGADGMGIDLKKLLSRRFYEMAYLSFYEIALQYLPVIRESSPETKIIVDSVDIHFIRERRMAETLRDETLMEKAEKTRQEELAIYGRADAVVTVTEQDWMHLKDHLPGKAHFVIPNVHPVDEDPVTCEGREGLLFIGNFNHPPNTDAVTSFVREVFPLVKRKIPEMTLTVVGNSPPEEIMSLRSEHITITGYVPETGPYLRKARVSISPLRFGSGMKGKIGEAMAAGLPVVTTSIGAEGMGLVSGRTAFIADDAESFSEAILRLCTDDRLWTETASAGKQYIRDHFSPANVDECLRAMVSCLNLEKREIPGPCGLHGVSGRKPIPGLVSIVILTFNEISYTKQCVESLRKNTPEPHEILFVDNGSKDGTVKWLRGLLKGNPNYRLIENPENLGFARGCNQGIEASKGEYILLLNNDVLVTKNWLSGMLEHLSRAPDIGIVGPMTNHISGAQKAEGVTYGSTAALEAFALEFRERNRHRRVPSRRLVGFCMLFRRSLLDDIGPLDETFGTGNFEDDDFCLRASLAGYRNIIAGDVFIHHYGSRSFIGNRIHYAASLAGNRKIFDEKWRCMQRDEAQGRYCLAMRNIEEGRAQYHLGRLNRAVDLYLEAIRFVPSEPKTYHEMAEMLIQTRNFKEALDVLREIPEEKQDGKTWVLTGFAKEGLNDDAEARDLADRVRHMPLWAAEALNLRGILAYKEGTLEEAASFFRQAMEADPSYGEAYTNLGVVKWKEGPGGEALRLLEKGFILAPHVADVANLYHAAAANLGELERAEAIFREARGLHPLNRTISFLLIDLLIGQEKYTQAMAEIERALTLFDLEDEFLNAALEIRKKLGPMEPPRKKRAQTISLCMIVRNEEANLVRCLSTIKPAVDEIIVVDTGSTDRSRGIAAAFGAKVFEIPWKDDFSEARNVSLAKATGDWILILDADESIAPCDFGRLRRLTSAADRKKRADGFILTTRNYSGAMNTEGWTPNDGSYGNDEAGPGWYPSRKVRLFRNDPRVRFKGVVHELVEDSMISHGMKIHTSDIPVHHHGSLQVKERCNKGEAYYQLGRKKVDQSEGNARAVYELAVQAARLGKYDESIDLWKRFLDSGSMEDLHLAYMNLGHAYLETGRYGEAAKASRRALEIDAGLKEARLNLAMSEFYQGRAGEAAAILEELIRKIPDYVPARALLAAALVLSGETGRYEATVAPMRSQAVNPAVFFQAYAEKMLSAGRDEDASRLLATARRIWRDLLASRGLEASDDEIERVMALAAEDRSPPEGGPADLLVEPERRKKGRTLHAPSPGFE